MQNISEYAKTYGTELTLNELKEECGVDSWCFKNLTTLYEFETACTEGKSKFSDKIKAPEEW